jgi:hypothetical protein
VPDGTRQPARTLLGGCHVSSRVALPVLMVVDLRRRREGPERRERGVAEGRTALPYHGVVDDLGQLCGGVPSPGPHRAVRRGLAFPRHPGRLPGQLLRPQSSLEARDHRAGLRTRFDDLLIEGDRLRLEAAYFDIDVEDFIDLEVDIFAGTTRPTIPRKPSSAVSRPSSGTTPPASSRP